VRHWRQTVAAISVASAAGLALSLPVAALADEPAPAHTGLPVRHEPPTPTLALAQEGSSSTGTKVALAALIGIVGFVMWSRRGRMAPPANTDLRVLKRMSLGLRNELLLVEVEGQRLLLGMTPHTIQNLYIAPITESAETAAEERIAAEDRPAREQESTRAPRLVRDASDDYIEEQARGLRSLLARK
jgi:flagellar protein FliO/FliZ